MLDGLVDLELTTLSPSRMDDDIGTCYEGKLRTHIRTLYKLGCVTASVRKGGGIKVWTRDVGTGEGATGKGQEGRRGSHAIFIHSIPTHNTSTVL